MENIPLLLLCIQTIIYPGNFNQYYAFFAPAAGERAGQYPGIAPGFLKP